MELLANMLLLLHFNLNHVSGKISPLFDILTLSSSDNSENTFSEAK